MFARLSASRDAGAEVVSACGLLDGTQLHGIVGELGGPVNAILLLGGQSIGAMTAAGVPRVSVGDGLSGIAYGVMVGAARTLLAEGADRSPPRVERQLAQAAFGGDD